MCFAGAESPMSAADRELPDLSLFGPDGKFIPFPCIKLPPYTTRIVADLLLNQPDLMGTPLINHTPSTVPYSPDMELIAPVQTYKDLQGTPQLVMTPTMPSPRSLSTGLFPPSMPGQFGFFQTDSSFPNDYGPNMATMDDILGLLTSEMTSNLPLPGTVSPADLGFPPPFTPGQSQDTPSVGATSPLLATPGRSTVPPPSVVVAASSSSASTSRKRTSPLPKTKRGRSEEEDMDSQSSKRRKHTGTRPGINAAQLIPPGAPPQSKTYVTESSTSRKDIPASYKLKPGELPSDNVVNKIVAKRTANRDSARRSRQRKQAAMEAAQGQINYLQERVQQLEEFIRLQGIEPPVPLRVYQSPKEEQDDEFE